MKNKLRISENDLIILIENFIKEDFKASKKTFGRDNRGMTDEEKAKEMKMEYFSNIFESRFREIKEVHGLELTVALLNHLIDVVKDEKE